MEETIRWYWRTSKKTWINGQLYYVRWQKESRIAKKILKTCEIRRLALPNYSASLKFKWLQTLIFPYKPSPPTLFSTQTNNLRIILASLFLSNPAVRKSFWFYKMYPTSDHDMWLLSGINHHHLSLGSQQWFPPCFSAWSTPVCSQQRTARVNLVKHELCNFPLLLKT